MKKMLTGVCLLLGSMGVNAGGVDLALSNETANISFVLNPHQFYEGGGAELALGAFMSEQGDRVAHATLMARGYRMSDGKQYSVGALGFQVGMLLVSSRHNPIEIAAEGFIAPSITSFSDAERYSELGARLQIEVVPQARAYIGYRAMRFNTNDYDDVRIDRSVHLGIKISY